VGNHRPAAAVFCCAAFGHPPLLQGPLLLLHRQNTPPTWADTVCQTHRRSYYGA